MEEKPGASIVEALRRERGSVLAALGWGLIAALWWVRVARPDLPVLKIPGFTARPESARRSAVTTTSVFVLQAATALVRIARAPGYINPAPDD